MAPSLSKNAADVMGAVDSALHLSITLEGSNFLANGHPIMTQVPANIISTPSPFISSDKTMNLVGCFVGFVSEEPKSRHVVPIGRLCNIKFMSIFSFKVWWTTHWVGSNGSDVEHETQMMILDKNDKGRPYVLLLPIIEGPFRAALNPYDDDYVAMCVESGSTQVCGSRFRSCLYMHVGDDPFNLVKEAMKVVRVHLGTFKLLEEKNPPGIVEKFGWCTWDAFYLKVNPKGIREGVSALVEGGCPPGLVLIDDGWQSISRDQHDHENHDGQKPSINGVYHEAMDLTEAGEQMPCRLTKFVENYKFRNYESPYRDSDKGMGAFIRDLKDEFRSVEHVYVWHAFCGYWGGVRPNVDGLVESRIVSPKLPESLQMTMEDLAVDKIVSTGVGLVPPVLVHKMFDGLHSHLQSVGIDGIKVDVIHLLEMLCEEYGGRVELEKAYYKALTSSIKKHFKGNGVIASMEHSNDFMLLGTEAIALGRVGDDFWKADPFGDPYWLQGCHMVHCAYNSLWMGNFIQPDWDMFQSTHACARFHAASRAISGGPIYVSDSVGNHDFELLKSLVLPDGSILRCQHYALPTRDCLFEDTLHDGKTMLKIWNLNKCTGVLGVFNCQGGGWCPKSRRNKRNPEYAIPLTCSTGPKDVEWNNSKTPIPLKGVTIFAVYMHQQKKLELLKTSENIEITLDPSNYELLVVSPVRVLTKKRLLFAVIGLVNMLNSGGAIQTVDIDEDGDLVRVGVKGSGEMRAFASKKPKGCKVDGIAVDFGYDDHDNIVTVDVNSRGRSVKLSLIDYLF